MAPHTAVEVFSIPELLHFILLELPLKDLLVVQGVCCQWYEAIETSETFQEKLFFQPTRDQSRPPEFNPLLKMIFPSFNEATTMTAGITRSMFHEVDWFKDPSRRYKFLRPEASWREMLSIQPYSKLVDVMIKCNCHCVWHEKRFGNLSYEYIEDMTEEDNIGRIGLIWDILAYLLDKTESAKVSIDWFGAGCKSHPTYFILMSLHRDCPRGRYVEPSGLAVARFDRTTLEWEDEPSHPSRFLLLSYYYSGRTIDDSPSERLRYRD
ncbi:hypothetical protein OIDMADRAFT_182778 [Oidiodendron maius Zn]|uniref:F-box domain-containing protein n=1 Tax=Oidiodendron maius (strain Zn) TaxID=913774 RepID=A0A0C3GMY0_OIDMZ|nr:hypothetical protein OIDMADRAFT_182778 [Oidiodendron maius Zn]